MQQLALSHNITEQPENQEHQEQQKQHELTVQEKKKKFPDKFTPRNSYLLFCMISVIVVVFTFVTFTFRKGENHLNPIAFIFHFSSFILTPLIIIWQNQNLKSYVVTTIVEILTDCSFNCSFFNVHKRIYPIVV